MSVPRRNLHLTRLYICIPERHVHTLRTICASGKTVPVYMYVELVAGFATARVRRIVLTYGAMGCVASGRTATVL
jgi:hypothetical protein